MLYSDPKLSSDVKVDLSFSYNTRLLTGFITPSFMNTLTNLTRRGPIIQYRDLSRIWSLYSVDSIDIQFENRDRKACNKDWSMP